MIEVNTPFQGMFIVKDPKKIEWWKKLAERNTGVIIKDTKNG